LISKLVRFVEGGGHLVLAFKSGFCDENSMVRPKRMPGAFRDVAGFSYQEFSTLKEAIPLKGDPFGVKEDNWVSVWAEMIQPEGCEVVAAYDHPFFGKFPAITQNQVGKGSLTYEGTVLSDALQEKVLLSVLDKAGLVGPDQSLPKVVRLKEGINQDGKRIRYYLNYSGNEQSFAYPHAPGRDLLSGVAVGTGQQVTLNPWDLVIIVEN
jgi:beta-galactosidase